jgi:hypothetical protein
MRWNSMSSTVVPIAPTSCSIETSVGSSFSARASWKSSLVSRSSLPSAVRRATIPSSDFFSRPSSWARFASDQTFASSSARVTSSSRFCLASKSKIPPQLGLAGGEVG